MAITEAEFRKLTVTIVDALTNTLGEHLDRVVRDRADEVLGRVLGANTDNLRSEIRTTIRKLVAEEIAEHLDVQVYWK
jgi:hypothetical protein